MKKNNTKKGFTLIELLIVIGIIGFLAAAVLVAVDPVKRIQDSRDSQRWSEVNGILNAILKKQVDDRALFSGGATYAIISHATQGQVISETTTGLAVCTSAPPTCAAITLNVSAAGSCWADLSGLVSTYLAEVPQDPQIGNATNSGYYINRNAGNRITIGACAPEQATTISVKR